MGDCRPSTGRRAAGDDSENDSENGSDVSGTTEEEEESEALNP